MCGPAVFMSVPCTELCLQRTVAEPRCRVSAPSLAAEPLGNVPVLDVKHKTSDSVCSNTTAFTTYYFITSYTFYRLMDFFLNR